MSHPSALISAYLDGELTASETRQLDTHLSGCGRCVAEMETTQRVRAAVRSLPLLELPADLTHDGEPNVTVLSRHRWVWATAAAVVAVVVALATLVNPPPPSMTFEDLTGRYSARVSLDPAFGPGKVVVPSWDGLVVHE